MTGVENEKRISLALFAVVGSLVAQYHWRRRQAFRAASLICHDRILNREEKQRGLLRDFLPLGALLTQMSAKLK